MVEDEGECNETCDDPKLVEKAQHGNRRAFTRLVECNQEKLFASMMKFLRCREEAEEAVQETFIRAFLRIDTFNADAKFSTWLHRIAFNSAISGRRKKRPTISIDQRNEDFGDEAIDSSDPSDAKMLRDEQITLVHDALDTLSHDHRAILVLRELDDLAYDEIANILDISTGTVRSRLSRARTQLRDAIELIQAAVRS